MFLSQMEWPLNGVCWMFIVSNNTQLLYATPGAIQLMLVLRSVTSQRAKRDIKYKRDRCCYVKWTRHGADNYVDCYAN